ncbi:MAG: type II secretion system protein M [Gammaproteobacteria bacterium]|nr:type II secretion system protein M [Gammaproteobacteria bacterium]
MRNYWDNLQSREQLIVAFAMIALLITVIFLSVVEPHLERKGQLQRDVQIKQENLNWMRIKAPLFKGEKKSISRTGQSLMSAIDQSAREDGLNSAIKKIQPEGKRVRVQFEQVVFDRMINWLSKIEQQFGYQVEGLVVERDDKVGLVNARVVIGEGS